MYQKKIEIGPPFAKLRFLLVTNYDKLLHISLSFMILAFLCQFVNAWLAWIIIFVLWFSKEIVDWFCGDEINAIASDLLADIAGGVAFVIWNYLP